MKPVQRLLVALLASIAIAAALSVIPMLDRTLVPDRSPSPPPLTGKPVVLTDRNLVDQLVAQPLHLRIARVEWSDAILSIDLKASPEEASPGSIYDDLYALARFGFAATGNVNQLLVRIMEQSASGKPGEMLLAMDAKRSDTGEAELLATSRGQEAKERFLSTRFSLTYTHKWLDRHRHGAVAD